KIQDKTDIQHLLHAVENGGMATTVRILPNIETARGLRLAGEIAADQRVCGLQLGLADLFEPLGIARYDPDNVRPMMLAVRLAAGENAKYAVDAAYADIKNLDGFRAEALLARSLGFIG